jgi:hypothetical protein
MAGQGDDGGKTLEEAIAELLGRIHPDQPPPDPVEIERRRAEREAQAAERLAEARARCPYEIVVVPGAMALAEWERLEAAGRGYPIVVGKDLARVIEAAENNSPGSQATVDILALASQLRFPESIFALRKDEEEVAERWLAEHGQPTQREEIESEPPEPPLGEWPDQPSASTGLTVASNLLTGAPLESVSIVLIPTDDWTTVPAHLRWGGWNACPPPEHQLAAFRSWRDRYGAKLIGLGGDVLNLRVARRPETRDEAMALAREQYAYCNDIVDQGVRTLSNLAAGLMANDWWFFWWD